MCLGDDMRRDAIPGRFTNDIIISSMNILWSFFDTYQSRDGIPTIDIESLKARPEGRTIEFMNIIYLGLIRLKRPSPESYQPFYELILFDPARAGYRNKPGLLLALPVFPWKDQFWQIIVLGEAEPVVVVPVVRVVHVAVGNAAVVWIVVPGAAPENAIFELIPLLSKNCTVLCLSLYVLAKQAWPCQLLKRTIISCSVIFPLRYKCQFFLNLLLKRRMFCFLSSL